MLLRVTWQIGSLETSVFFSVHASSLSGRTTSRANYNWNHCFNEILTTVQATSAGAKDQEAENWLEKKVKADSNFSLDETIQTAIGALQNVLSEEFKPSEIQVGLVSADNDGKFRELSHAEIEDYLTAISERDWVYWPIFLLASCHVVPTILTTYSIVFCAIVFMHTDHGSHQPLPWRELCRPSDMDATDKSELSHDIVMSGLTTIKLLCLGPSYLPQIKRRRARKEI